MWSQKKKLTDFAERIYKADQEAEKAKKAAKSAFGLGDLHEGVPELKVTTEQIENGYWVSSALVDAGLVASKSDATRLVKQGGAYLNDDKIMDPKECIRDNHFKRGLDIPLKYVMLRAGKKKYARITLL